MSQSQSNQKDLDNLILALPIQQKVSIVAIKSNFDLITQLNTSLQTQIKNIQLKYSQLSKPILQRTTQIVQGAPIKKQQLSNPYALKFFPSTPSESQLKGRVIQNYWSIALQNSKLQNIITQQDIKALNHLKNISYERATNKVIIRFEFSTNPYFQQTKVTRELIIKDDQPEQTKGDLLHWKQGNNLIYELKKVVNKKTGQTKMVESDKKKPSFFHFFANHHQNQSQQAKQHLHVQEAIFNDFINQIIPYSLQYYLGVASDETDVNQQQQDYDDDDNQQDEQQQQQVVDRGPSKKRKNN